MLRVRIAVSGRAGEEARVERELEQEVLGCGLRAAEARPFGGELIAELAPTRLILDEPRARR